MDCSNFTWLPVVESTCVVCPSGYLKCITRTVYYNFMVLGESWLRLIGYNLVQAILYLSSCSSWILRFYLLWHCYNVILTLQAVKFAFGFGLWIIFVFKLTIDVVKKIKIFLRRQGKAVHPYVKWETPSADTAYELWKWIFFVLPVGSVWRTEISIIRPWNKMAVCKLTWIRFLSLTSY
jgi:hypothetical protein